MIAALAAAITMAATAQVDLRGGEQTPPGDIVSITDEGVSLGATGAAYGAAQTLIIGWDWVRAVHGPMAERAAPFLAAAEQAWRARTRLERGDPIAAEPLFEKLFEHYRGQRGPTAAVVAEGLLRCRLRQAAHVGAIDPWLALLDAAPDPTTPVFHQSWAMDAGLSPVIDPATGLVAALPPMWVSWPSVDAYARATPWTGAAPSVKPGPGAGRVAMLATLYHQAACAEAGLAVSVTEPPSADPGVQLVAQIVLARTGDAERRSAARKALLERLRPAAAGAGQAPSPPAPWMEAWIHAAIGRSLLKEESEDQKQQGIIELLKLPARFSPVHPYLAGLAIAEASVELRLQGDHDGADILAREVLELYPTHPVLHWPPFRVSQPNPATPGPRPVSAAGVDAPPPKVQ
jgi:hypothetical protein